MNLYTNMDIEEKLDDNTALEKENYKKDKGWIKNISNHELCN